MDVRIHVRKTNKITFLNLCLFSQYILSGCGLVSYASALYRHDCGIDMKYYRLTVQLFVV